MRKLKVEDAVGEVLCHDMTGILANGFKGVVFHRGQVITEADVEAMKDIGKNHVYVWEPEADEVHEDDAALAICKAVCGNGTAYGEKPSEGKVTVTAQQDGLFVINTDALAEINSVQDYSVVCLPNFFPVSKGTKICGARIIPLVTKRENVDRAVALADANYPVLSVVPYMPLRVGLIITGSEVYYGRIEDRFEPIMRAKLEKFGAEFLGAAKCLDELDMIQGAIDEFMKQDAQLILLTGGMSVDPDDLTPTAMRATGAEMLNQGLPMQPGNMLTMAKLGETMLVGVPGASMHSKTTSLDVFLPRIFAGLEIRPEELSKYGDGGLCMGCDECTYPRCYFGRGGA